jgi:putative ABC transport system ATP-binding protein
VPKPILATKDDSILAIKDGSVTYGASGARVQALAGVTLAFAPSTVTLIMGPSGSGKTTLLSVLGCLLRPDTGQVFVEGKEAGKLSESERTIVRRLKIGFIFQAFRLFRSLNAFENVMLAAEIAGRADGAMRDRARQLLDRFGMSPKLKLKPKALSGGEKQRIAIARALLCKPRILLADEPTASLDSQAGRQICQILQGLAAQDEQTIVVVSHDPRWEKFAHRTVVLEDGRVVDDRLVTTGL